MIEITHHDSTKYVEGLPPIKLIFADPPFNIGQDYAGHDDNQTVRGYLEFTRIWINISVSYAEANNATLALHGPDGLIADYLSVDGSSLSRLAWINWYYSFGQNNPNNWVDARTHLLVYGHDGHTFHPPLVKSWRERNCDKRASGKGKVPGTVWGINEEGEQQKHWGRVTGNSKERHNAWLHPNQLPELYLARIVETYTDPGDCVLDMFGGSGTMPVVCKALGRDCLCWEKSKACCASILQRLEKGAVRL